MTVLHCLVKTKRLVSRFILDSDVSVLLDTRDHCVARSQTLACPLLVLTMARAPTCEVTTSANVIQATRARIVR